MNQTISRSFVVKRVRGARSQDVCAEIVDFPSGISSTELKMHIKRSWDWTWHCGRCASPIILRSRNTSLTPAFRTTAGSFRSRLSSRSQQFPWETGQRGALLLLCFIAFIILGSTGLHTWAGYILSHGMFFAGETGQSGTLTTRLTTFGRCVTGMFTREW
ncbi:unnamed protein product [Vitrella brassicaformis CCMP3155]|uniref:Uncharacterized protein n=1 Tax=Vitrella brassicaformis (strain CCMP3155) TaxID=1169540 RepID=A0A0G4G8H8_VITBC|nr:unnamed protein product [Vitrella brassicaformis CCMP3155]|eukprot:CEM24659.1 unnamed protein product [Vitrella brassicaformis CCMP3155]